MNGTPVESSFETVQISDVFKLLRRNARATGWVMFICMATATAAFLLLPKAYKSKGVLNIQASYFQIPLVDDIVSTVNDPAAQSTQREALLRLAVNDEFVDQLAEDFKVYKTSRDDPKRAKERKRFRSAIEYFAVTSTAFQISVQGRTPERSLEMTRRVLDRMMTVLIDERFNNLIKTRNAIQSNIQSLGLSLRGITPPPISASAAKEELGKLEASIVALTQQFTEQHPEVVRLKRRAEVLKRVIDTAGAASSAGISAGAAPGPGPDVGDTTVIPSGPGSKQATQELYNELVRKLNFLNIVLEMEKDRTSVSYLTVLEHPTLQVEAHSPNPKVVFGGGFVAGLLLSIVLVVFRELKRGSFLSPALASESMGVPFLGALPPFVNPEKMRLLEGPASPTPIKRRD